MSTITRADALNAVREAIAYANPADEDRAQEVGVDALAEFLDSSLIYAADALALWDWSTHEDVDLHSYHDLTDAITASVYLQLCDDWADVVEQAASEHLAAA